MLVQSSIVFESMEEIYERVFRELRPSLAIPSISVRFHCFTNLTSNIRLVQGQLRVKVSDLLENAPLAVQGVKRAVNHVAYRGFDDAANFESLASSVLWTSEDVYKGFAAKARKEQAEFEGQ